MLLITGPQCPVNMNYNVLRGVCYSSQPEATTDWDTGNTYCANTYPGGHIFYITTPEELARMQTEHGEYANAII